MHIQFLYATQSGNAEVLAGDFADAVPDGCTGEAKDIDSIDTDIFDNKDDFYVLIIATYGEGDYPFTAEEFFEDLEDEAPDLSGVKFASFGLGDISYEESYNLAIKNASALLEKLGATRIGDIGEHDAASDKDPEEVGMPWWETIKTQL